ncbi:MAG: PorT family protein [Cytophagales bacterium]|nr:PorT family protein [Cytophagales bacterium]
MLKIRIKLSIILALTAFLLSAHCKAQTYIGIKRGVSLSQVMFDGVDPAFDTEIVQEQTRGDITGFMFRFLQDKHAGLQFEVNLIDKGWTQVLENFKYKTELKYLNVYAQTIILIGKRKFRPLLIAGPYLSYLYDSESPEIPDDQTENIPFVYDNATDNEWDFGLGGGGGFSLKTAIGNFQVVGKFSLGLSNIIDKQQVTEPEFSRNQTVEISLSYAYPFFNKNKE